MAYTDVDHSGEERLWRLGLILEAGTSLSPLQANPLSVVLVPQTAEPPSSTQIDAISVCKSSLLDTYDFVSDYEQGQGCPVKAADLEKCRWPNVLVVPSTLTSGGVNVEAAQVPDIQSPDDLQVKVGSSHPVSPTLILTSHHFMAIYGFASRERVWFRLVTPVPLERVVLGIPAPGWSESQTRRLIGQLYEQCRAHHVMAHQGLDLLVHPRDTGSGLGPVSFSVLHTSPVMQGRVTEKTTIAVLPPDDQAQTPFPSPRRERRTRAMSALSASDMNYEYMYSYSSFLHQPTLPQDFIIEVIPAPRFKLHSQYIVLPKDTAMRHKIFSGQPVLLSRVDTELEVRMEGGGRTMSELVVQLEPPPLSKKGGRQHLAIAMWYENEAALQKYVPAPSLLHRYEEEALEVAYIDSYLLFSLFPESLASSRRFQLRIATIPADSVPPIKDFMVSLVTIPAGRTQLTKTQHITHLKNFFQDKFLNVELGDVFCIETEVGDVHYTYHKLDPQARREVQRGTIDGRSYKNCSVMVNQAQSYVPYLVPPSSIFPDQGFWTHLHPPGLDQFCDTLFSWLVPSLLPRDQRPSCSPSVLLSAPSGAGKGTVIKAVVRRCRMNIMELNCFEFSSEALGRSEQKLMSDLSNALMSNPVVVVLSHVHVLGRTQDGKEEPRVATAFETFISDVSVFNKKRDYPVVIIGTTSQPSKVSPQVHACFLHHMELTPPSLAQREALLTGLSSEYLVARDVDWPDLSRRTAGFVLGDFISLFSRASQLAWQESTSYCSRTGNDCNVEDRSVAGVVISQDHLEAALDVLHSSYSDAIGAPKIPNVQWEDVGGLAGAKREILDTIQLPLLHPELFTAGLRRSGVLLYGAPGTGKTLLAKAVATECSLNFLSVKGPELINMYVGQSEENVREVFVRARSAAPCVIFFDELDSIAPNRGKSGDSGGVMDRVVSQLLAELDGLQKSEDVFVIGATNRPDLLDQALLRPGRFDRLVYLGVCEDVESKTKVLKAITRKFNLDPAVNLEHLASQCPANLTGADLYSLCSDAALTALRRQINELESKGLSDDEWEGELVVSEADFLQALSSLTPSVSPEELKRYTELGTNTRASKS